jgi:hypothetical protein
MLGSGRRYCHRPQRRVDLLIESSRFVRGHRYHEGVGAYSKSKNTMRGPLTAWSPPE